MKKFILISGVLAWLGLGVSAQTNPAATATDTAAMKHGWHFLLEPYLMFPNMNGNVALGRLPTAHVDLNPSDIFSHFQTGVMLYFEASNDRWTISSDFMYMDLAADIDSALPILEGHAEVRQLGWELALLRKFKPWLSAGIGFELNSIQSELNLKLDSGRGPFQVSGNQTRTWVDPSLIAAVNLPLGTGGKWDFRGRGNVGGFGIGSKIYWQLQANIDYHVSKLFQASVGYRAIKVDYEKGSGSEYFMDNLITFGPVIRIGFNF